MKNVFRIMKEILNRNKKSKEEPWWSDFDTSLIEGKDGKKKLDFILQEVENSLDDTFVTFKSLENKLYKLLALESTVSSIIIGIYVYLLKSEDNFMIPINGTLLVAGAIFLSFLFVLLGIKTKGYKPKGKEPVSVIFNDYLGQSFNNILLGHIIARQETISFNTKMNKRQKKFINLTLLFVIIGLLTFFFTMVSITIGLGVFTSLFTGNLLGKLSSFVWFG